MSGAKQGSRPDGRAAAVLSSGWVRRNAERLDVRREGQRGKSGLRRAGRWGKSQAGRPVDSATESKPPQDLIRGPGAECRTPRRSVRSRGRGKGETVR